METSIGYPVGRVGEARAGNLPNTPATPGDASLRVVHVITRLIVGGAQENTVATVLGLRALPGLEALLRALESVPVPKAIATSSGRAYTRTVLSQFDYVPRFQFVLTGEDVREGKPAPEVYLTAARQLGVPPAAMMVLEDSENGCRAGVAAGAYTVAVPGPHSQHHDFDRVAFVALGLADARIYRALGLPPPI